MNIYLALAFNLYLHTPSLLSLNFVCRGIIYFFSTASLDPCKASLAEPNSGFCVSPITLLRHGHYHILFLGLFSELESNFGFLILFPYTDNPEVQRNQTRQIGKMEECSSSNLSMYPSMTFPSICTRRVANNSQFVGFLFFCATSSCDRK